MRNYTQEQKLQLQTLISQEAMLPAKLFKYLRSEELSLLCWPWWMCPAFRSP